MRMTSSKQSLRSGNHTGGALRFTQVGVYGSVLASHTVGRKPLLKDPAAHDSTQTLDFPQGLHGFILIACDESGFSHVHDFGNRAKRVSDDGRTTSHGFDHGQSEGLRPFDGE